MRISEVKYYVPSNPAPVALTLVGSQNGTMVTLTGDLGISSSMKQMMMVYFPGFFG